MSSSQKEALEQLKEILIGATKKVDSKYKEILQQAMHALDEIIKRETQRMRKEPPTLDTKEEKAKPKK